MSDRFDSDGAANAGSQLQTQLYVNRRTEALDEAIRSEFAELAEAQIEWRSPLATERYAEYSDRSFLERLGLEAHAAKLRAFWPSGGPHWDGLAVFKLPQSERPGVILAEGKSYPEEFYAGGCKAKPGSLSRTQIEKSLTWTQTQLGVRGKNAQDWCGPLYQSANRLAHLCWLHSLTVRAWLVHLLFVDDPHQPTTAAEWSSAVAQVNAELGLAEIEVKGAGHVRLPAGSREELIGPG